MTGVIESETTQTGISGFIGEFLEHHGVKGMKWGVHKEKGVTSTTERSGKLARKSTDVTVTQKPGRFVKTVGGKKQTASSDAVKVAASRQFAKKSTTDSLSTKQLQEAVLRMNLEKQYQKLVKETDRRDRGKKFIDSVLGNKDLQKFVLKSAAKAVV